MGIVPRAVGSTFPPITCDATDAISDRRYNEFMDALPGYTNKSLVESYAVGKAIGLDCASVTPDLIPYAGTVHVARDMDYVLQALSQDKLSYLYVSSIVRGAVRKTIDFNSIEDILTVQYLGLHMLRSSL